jgi:branched-chain amino acid aminotransferase
MPEEMAKASECFLTGTAAEVTPVGKIGEYKFTPGEISANLDADYVALVNGRSEAAVAAE